MQRKSTKNIKEEKDAPKVSSTGSNREKKDKSASDVEQKTSIGKHMTFVKDKKR